MTDTSSFKHAPALGQAAMQGARASALAPACAQRVLLAEDTPISAEMMAAMAEHLGAQFDIASNGIEAIEMIQAAKAARQPYSLLLVDIFMPILDGIETAKRLRELGIGAEELPIIAVTAATDIDEVRSYRAAGMQAFIEKPVGLDQMRAVLGAWSQNFTVKQRKTHSDTMAALEIEFDKRKANTLGLINEMLAAPVPRQGQLLELRSRIHQIAGTAGSFGDNDLSEAARLLEAELIEFIDSDADCKPTLKKAQQMLRRGV